MQLIDLLCCNRGLLGDNQPLDNPSHVHSVGVRGDVDKALFTEFVEPPLLRLDDFLVLEKGWSDFAVELLGRLGVVLPVAVCR